MNANSQKQRCLALRYAFGMFALKHLTEIWSHLLFLYDQGGMWDMLRMHPPPAIFNNVLDKQNFSMISNFFITIRLSRLTHA